MTRPTDLTFRDVIPAIERVLHDASWPGPGREVTLLRDLDGRVRLMVESPVAGAGDKAVERPELERRLREALGDWLGEPMPVWAPDKSDQAVVDLIRRDRQPWPIHPAPPFAAWQLDRHVARHGWVGDLPHSPPWSLQEVDDGDRPPIWVFFSHKGGVGRSTALVGVASQLARRGLRVTLVDLDLEAPGLGALVSGPDDDGPGLLDVWVGPPGGVGDRLAGATRQVTAPYLVGAQPITLLPAGHVDADYLRMLARLDLQGTRDVQAATERLRDVFEQLREQSRPDVVLVDARAGFHDVGGIALAALSHGVVFFGLPNEQSWVGLEAVARVVGAAGRDEDGDPKLWLQVVHCHANGREEDAEKLRFQDKAWEILRDQRYYGEVLPDVRDPSAPHFPIVIPWKAELRGAGGLVTPRALEAMDESVGRLAERLVRRFAGTEALWEPPL
ncbi:MAG TPA: P-loop NTPase [Myxococcota bacterium]|nr:P-loop NTPase [Myxococcota bacterium]